MSRPMRLLLLAGALLAIAAACGLAGAGAPTFSRASYTTSSQSDVTASVDTASNWLHVYSQASDPDHAVGYARTRLLNGAWGGPAATGQDAGIVVDMGDFPDRRVLVDFDRTFSIETPLAFPDPAVTQITVALTVLPDPDTGDRLLVDQSLTPFGQTTGAVQTVTLGPDRKYQFNVSVQARKRFQLGRDYYPRVVLSLTVAGVANAFRYEFPLQVTDAGGS